MKDKYLLLLNVTVFVINIIFCSYLITMSNQALELARETNAEILSLADK